VRPGTAAGVETGRFDVRSADGTSIAVWVEGSGPPLVLVHGSLTDHTTFAPFLAELRDGLTTVSMDRRGYGASGDGDGYAIEREFEDVAAVVEAVAARTGRRSRSSRWRWPRASWRRRCWRCWPGSLG
jgi:pimeloyl-ACP methyl ester carboxylesterase